MEKIAEYVGGEILAFIMVFPTAYYLTRFDGPSKSAFKSYVCCASVMVAIALGLAKMDSGPVYPGDTLEHEYGGVEVATQYKPPPSERAISNIAHRAFYYMIIPALIGVYGGRRDGPQIGEL